MVPSNPVSSGTRTGAMWMLVAGVSTALQGACVHALQPVCDWRVVVLVRTTLGFVFALALVRAAGARIPWPGPRELWLRSGAGSIAFLCTFYGAAHIPVADATVLINTSPIWITLFSWIVFRRRLRAAAWLAVLLGTAGIVLIARPHFAQRNLGAATSMASGFLIAISMMAIGRMRHVHPAAIVAHATAAAVVTSGIALGASISEIDGAFLRSPRALALLAAVALLGTIAQVALTRAYSIGNATRLAPLQYLAVAFAAVADFAFFGHAPGAATLFGILLIVLPMVWVMTHRPDGHAVRHAELAHVPEIPADEHVHLEAAVRRAEALSSCELRVHLDRACADRVARPREVFQALGVAKTRLRNGVLVYLAIESRVFAVVVDEGISDLVPEGFLDAACARVTAAMANGDARRVVEEGIVEVSRILGRWFPHQGANDVNELPDTISVGW